MAGSDGGVVVVVGRDQPALYDYFRWGFARFHGVDVVLDRRFGERRERRGAAPGRDEPSAGADRRRVHRRRAPGTRGELLARGFLIVRCERRAAGPGPGAPR
jgi:hypothetical protein